LVCLALAVAANGESLLKEDIPPSEELEPEEVLAKLSSVVREQGNFGATNQFVARTLLAAKNKDSKVDFADVTVAELISLHHIKREDCSQAVMSKRYELYERTLQKYLMAQSPRKGIEFAVTAYTEHNLRKAAEYCFDQGMENPVDREYLLKVVGAVIGNEWFLRHESVRINY
jgi:hypothetical protein